MNQQNRVVETIINKIISQSRKNSLQSIDCRTISQKSEQSNESEPFDQEYIIKKSDLRVFIQKMALQNYENNIRLEDMELEMQQYKKDLIKSLNQIDQLKQTLEGRELTFKKRIEDTEARHNKEKKKREQMELQLIWSTNKIKDQLREIEKLKQSVIIKNQPKCENQNGAANYSEKKDKNQYLTPGKESSKRLENLATKNCESIQYSLLNSDIVHKMVDHHPAIKEYNTQHTKQARTERNYVLNSVENVQLKHKQANNSNNVNTEISRLHRHAEVDQKQRIIKCLGEKCIFLQSYIQKLTKKYLGEVVYNEEGRQRAKERSSIRSEVSKQNLRVIEEQSVSSLQRNQSDVELSSAFRVQPQL